MSAFTFHNTRSFHKLLNSSSPSIPVASFCIIVKADITIITASRDYQPYIMCLCAQIGADTGFRKGGGGPANC